jgi:peptide/nickel transport system ATP-binding protein
VSFDVAPGETLGLVGESGCGKSTTGRAIICLPRPTSGTVTFQGTDITGLPEERLRRVRPQLQIIFQDPISSLNPRRRIADTIAEPLKVWGDELGLDAAEREARLPEMMDAVGLDLERQGDRRPQEFSGGQCQRVSIARALMLRPKLLICDEPVSALDTSVRAQILNLLEDMKARYALTMIFVAHDLAVVKRVSDRLAVMYLGRLCEIGDPERIYRHPAHPYTAALLSSIPEADPAAPTPSAQIHGDPPSPIDPPSGCRFRTRCPKADQLCADVEPVMRTVGPDQHVACHHPDVVPVEPAGGRR